MDPPRRRVAKKGHCSRGGQCPRRKGATTFSLRFCESFGKGQECGGSMTMFVCRQGGLCLTPPPLTSVVFWLVWGQGMCFACQMVPLPSLSAPVKGSHVDMRCARPYSTKRQSERTVLAYGWLYSHKPGHLQSKRFLCGRWGAA